MHPFICVFWFCMHYQGGGVLSFFLQMCTSQHHLLQCSSHKQWGWGTVHHQVCWKACRLMHGVLLPAHAMQHEGRLLLSGEIQASNTVIG